MISPTAYEFIKGLLTHNFRERLGFNGVQEIKDHKFFHDVDWKALKQSIPPLM